MKISKVCDCNISKEDFEEQHESGDIRHVTFEPDNCGGYVMYILEVKE